MRFITSLLLITACLTIVSCQKQEECPISRFDAVKAIVGESENQDYLGMLLVAECIRNRGHLGGVYGREAITYRDHKFYRGSRRIPDYIIARAVVAWKKSKYTNLTKGANHWENVKEFGVPSWSRKMIATVSYKNHVFYKEV